MNAFSLHCVYLRVCVCAVGSCADYNFSEGFTSSSSGYSKTM